MLSRHDAIGIFDSGVGGLTVFREMRKRLPAENLIYLGDTARVPYGTKSKEIVQLYSLQAARFLQKKGVKAIVVACNTASSCALPLLRRSFPKLPITGVIEPGAEAALAASPGCKVGVIGTERTIRSRAYRAALHKLAPQTRVYDRPCPLFVPLAEEGLTHGPLAEGVIRHYLAGLKKKGIETLILGCTHYPLLKGAIGKVLGRRIRLVDSAVEVARKTAAELAALGLLKRSGGRGRSVFYVTDTPAKFSALARRFLGHGGIRAAQATIEG
jgi:glutamate racemase